MGPDYKRPSAVAPALYKEWSGWKVAQPRDEVLRGAWWELFQDPRLNALQSTDLAFRVAELLQGG